MKVIALIAAFIIIFCIDLPFMLKTTGKVKYVVIYVALLIAGLLTGLLQVLDKAPVSPAKLLYDLIKG